MYHQYNMCMLCLQHIEKQEAAGGGRVYHQYNICMLCLQHLEKQEEAAGGVCITNITCVCCVCST